MPEFCLKKEIEKKLPTNDRFTIALILLCCNFCKKVHEKSEIDKYSKLFVEPLWISMKKEKHAFFRAMGYAILEHTAELFPSSSDEQAEMQNIVASAKRAASSGNNKELIDCFSSVSHSTYLKMMAQWHFYELYDAGFAAALCYLSAKADIRYMAFRTQFLYAEDNTVFFDIGVSLDEGFVEYTTQQITQMLGEECLEDAYYFEVEFYKKIAQTFGIKRQEEGEVIFKNGGPMLLYEHTKHADKCAFYQLLQLSDCQNWREASQILKHIVETESNGNDL